MDSGYDWSAEARLLAKTAYKNARLHLGAARNTAAAVEANDPYIGHPAQVAVEVEAARYWWRWYCIFNSALRQS